MSNISKNELCQREREKNGAGRVDLISTAQGHYTAPVSRSAKLLCVCSGLNLFAVCWRTLSLSGRVQKIGGLSVQTDDFRHVAQAPTKDSDALDIETICNIVDSVLWPLDDLVRQGVTILDFGDRVAFETVQLNIRMQ